MEELKVGMYCYDRCNRKIGIGKIVEFRKNNNVVVQYKNFLGLVSSGNIIASDDITDLIEENDIILGYDGKVYQVWKIYKDYVFTYSKNKYGQTITLVDYQIDKILTKEQFENNCYRRYVE